MNVPIRRLRLAARAVPTLVVAAVAGCGHMPQWPSAPHLHWPFGHRASPAPEPVEELVIEPGGNPPPAFLQFWERNTLVVDMRSATGTGTVTLTPRAHTVWPVRIAFRVTPGAIGQLEVQGAERSVFPVASTGAAPVDLELGPSAYTQRTPTLTLAWGPAPALPPPPTPATRPAAPGTATSSPLGSSR